MALREHLSQRRDEYKDRFAQFSAMTEGAEAETVGDRKPRAQNQYCASG